MAKKKLLAALIVGAAIALGTPAAANADDYTAGSPCALDISVVQAGDTATLICQPGTWADSELVAWTGSGQDGSSMQLASFHSSVSSVHFSKHANADGSDKLTIVLPADAVGSYTIVGDGQTSGHVCSATLTVLPADSSGAATGSSSNSGSNSDPSASGQQMADTGSTIAWSIAWVGGGLIVLGLIALAIIAWARRVRES